MVVAYDSFSSKQFMIMIGKSFLLSFGWYVTIIVPYIIFGISSFVANHFSLSPIYTIATSFSIIQCLCFFAVLKAEIEELLNRGRHELRTKIEKWQKEKESLEKEHSAQLANLKQQKRFAVVQSQIEREKLEKEHSLHLADWNKKEKILKDLLFSKTPFKDSATMYANVESLVFAESSKYLKHKSHPAPSAAKEVDNMRQIFNKRLQEAKEIQYKYEYILSAFPEIAEYVEHDGDLLEVGEHSTYSDIDDLRDRRKDYLSVEEYNSLSEDEKSQLALDRYVASRNKSRWHIGRDYEMCCAFHLKQQGFSVEMHGIKFKKNDLGRDLIAIKQWGDLFGNEVWIVQCKNWSSKYEIHENVIMQLFGTAIEYQLTDKQLANKHIIPVLMVPYYTRISDMATNFAKKLKVRIERVPFSDFPRIKCNINNNCKIFHLPFDQQYDRTEIKLTGECYVSTVAEAVSLGFRRAKRHIPYS